MMNKQSTAYFERSSNKRFTLISPRVAEHSVKGIWDEFWEDKDDANEKLLRAVEQGDEKKVHALIANPDV